MSELDREIRRISDEALRERYRIEREKRLRSDGNAQYRGFSGVYKDFDKDPYVAPGFTRDPITEETDALVIGGGFGGMLAAINLRKHGVNSFRIVEKGGDFGGTWYWNRYPGAACDVESYTYLPLLEETGFMPTEKYAKAPEIFAYCQLLGRTFDLYAAALFQTEISQMQWDDSTDRWNISTTRNDRIAARFVIIAGGVLHKAKLPGITGIESFEGHSFHTSRWEYDYTGGSSLEPLVGLADKRVGIIGTGATAVQIVPKLAESAKEVFVFQRTPSSVGVRDNAPTDPEWFSSLEPGWQQERIRNFTAIVAGHQPPEDLVGDGWTKLLRTDTRRRAESPEEERALEHLDFENMENIRARIESIVQDPSTAESLKPWYNQMCKRPCFHDEYLPAFNRPNVNLVDTDGKGVEEITPHGVVVGGVEHEVDCLIYASGFEVTTDYTDRLGFDPIGRDGTTLSASWVDGPSTLHGVMTRGFPNMLMISTIQGGQTINFVHAITEAAQHVAIIVKRCEDLGIVTIEPTVEAQQEWFNVIMSTLGDVGRYNLACTPGYLNNEGGGTMRTARSAAYMRSLFEYLEYIEAWRESPELVGVDCKRRSL